MSRTERLFSKISSFYTRTRNLPISTDDVVDVIYYSMPTWKNKMIQQRFNYTSSTVKEMNDFLETRAENLEPREG